MYTRETYCTHPEQSHCDCDWCRIIPHLQPLHPDVTLSTGKVIHHTYARNGSQDAMPEMTAVESSEYGTIRTGNL